MPGDIYKMKLKKGDTVIVRNGKFKGQTGKIVQVHPKDNKVTIEGINIVKRHVKPNRTNPQGGIFELTKPLFASKVALYNPTSKKMDKVAYKITSNGSKARVYKSSAKEIKNG